MNEQQQRLRVIAEAMLWKGTPFHRDARVLHVGVDCANLIAAVYEACEVFKAEEWGFFGNDWHLNTTRDFYMEKLIKYATQLPKNGVGLPGDIVLAQHSCNLAKRDVSFQGGIVVDYPMIIHAHPSRGVVISSAMNDPIWMGWDKAFFNPWGARDVQTK